MKIISVHDSEHIKKVAALANEIWRETYAGIVSDAQIEYMLANLQSAEAIKRYIEKDNHLYYLMQDDSGFVGYFAVQIQKDKMFLSKLYVRKESRRQGYAKKCIEFLFDMAQTQNCTEIYLTAAKGNIRAMDAYGKLGFKIVSEIKIDIGNGFFMDDYKMSLNVPRGTFKGNY